MRTADLRALRLQILDGTPLTDEQSLAIVTALEDIAYHVDGLMGSVSLIQGTKMLTQCDFGENCVNSPVAIAAARAIRRL
jgi:hypothetical protein